MEKKKNQSDGQKKSGTDSYRDRKIFCCTRLRKCTEILSKLLQYLLHRLLSVNQIFRELVQNKVLETRGKKSKLSVRLRVRGAIFLLPLPTHRADNTHVVVTL